MANPVRSQTQAQRLADALSARGLSKREFGKMLAGQDATLPEQEAMRRQVQKWLHGQRMLPASARRVAEILDEPVDLWLTPTQARDTGERLAQLEERATALEAQLRETTALLQELLADRSGAQERQGAH